MNIVYVAYTYWPPDFGGELLISVERFQTLVKRGHTVTVLTPGKPGFPKMDTVDGITIRRSPVIHDSRFGRLLRMMVYVLWTIGWLLRLRYEVVHFGSIPGIDPITTALVGWLFARTAKLKRARTLWVLSLADTETTALDLSGSRRFMREFLNVLTHIVAVSPALYQAAYVRFGAKAIALPYGVRTDLFKPLDATERARIRHEIGLRPDDTVFVFLGSIGYRKGFDVLAQAFASLNRTHPTWKLLVLGPRTVAENQNLDEDEVQKVTAPLTSGVLYYGRENDRRRAAELVGAGDVFVFPSRREGMGVAPMEAMAAALPAIIARLPGFTDQANIDGETGLYVPPGDVEALQYAMERLGCDPALRQAMGQKASQRIITAFNWQNYIHEWETLYTTGSLDTERDTAWRSEQHF